MDDSNSARRQEVDTFNQLSKIFCNFFAWVFVIIGIKITDTEEALFIADYSVITAILLVIVLYSLASVLGTMLRLHVRNFLPLAIFLLLLGSVASVLILSIASLTVAWLTLVLCLYIFALIGYYYHQELYELIPERVRRLIESENSQSSPSPDSESPSLPENSSL